MKPFLKKVLEEIIKNHPDDLGEVCIVLPGKRPSVYLKKYFGELLEGTYWLPDMLSISDFVGVLTSQEVSTKDDLLFRFFEIYQEQPIYTGETFDSFLLWAPQAIADYNDVDNYLKDGKYIFQDLTNLKVMDEWGRENTDDENYSWSFNNQPLSDQQQNFLTFWEKLGKLYHVLQADCLKNKMYYSGLLNRILAENIGVVSSPNPRYYSKKIHTLIESNISQWKKIYFVGLHALSSSEEKFVFSLANSKKAITFWDVDSFYLNNPIHEAGMFLRRYKKKEKNFRWESDYLSRKNLEINIHETSTDSSQVKFAGDLLQQNNSLSKAVILANENLLIPLLHSIPDLEQKVNVTLGYPLINTPFFGWAKKTIQLMKHIGSGVYFKDFLEWSSHPFVLATLKEQDLNVLEGFSAKLIRDNTAYLRQNHFKEIASQSKVLGRFFVILLNSFQLESLIDYLSNCILAFREALKEEQIHIESLYEFSKIINRLKGFSEKYSFVETIETFEKLFIKLSNGVSLSFLGEPLQGDQIMGMLESRTLDFDQVIILGANEGFLPSVQKNNSFIPYELKRFYGLPTHRENEAIFAYNFYRILHRATRVDILYSSAKVSLGSTDPSRYVSQIRHEFPDLVREINENIVLSPQALNHTSEVMILVNETIAEETKDVLFNGISPSAFNTYLRCPLDFYYRYVIGFNEVEEVEENIQLNTFGTIVHEVLEDFYKEILGQKLTLNHIIAWEKRIDEASEKAFFKVFKTGNYTEGVNYIALQVARRYLINFFEHERKEVLNLEKEGKSIKILALEKPLRYTFDLSKYGYDMPLTIRGFADRIDEIAGKTRIVDYKTGGTEGSDLKVKFDFSNVFEGKKPKALQVVLYAFLYHKINETPLENIESGIISFKDISNGFMSFGFSKITKNEKSAGAIYPDNLSEFLEEKIAELVIKMTEENQEWEHQEKSDFCSYC